MNLTGQFLIAMPAMTDPRFSKTVTYICTHNADGAMGVIINRSADITVGELFAQIKLETESTQLLNKLVHFGGPVQTERGFILHEPSEAFDSTIVINDMMALTTSKDILEAAADGDQSQKNAPQKMLIALGYAGWAAGQLEQEISQNAWLNLETRDAERTHKLIFEADNTDKFDFAMGLLGLNLANLSEVAGHA